MSGSAIFNFRNRLLSSERFRSIAQKLPFGQWVANRRASQLFRLCGGFIHSQVLLACVRLQLFERLRDGSCDVDELARAVDIPPQRLRHLLQAAAAISLLQSRPGDHYGLGVLGAAMVDNASVQAMVEHHSLFYQDLVDPVRLFRDETVDTQISRLWPYAAAQNPGDLAADDVGHYTSLMAASQAMVAEQVLDAWSMRHLSSLMDLGGGAGAFAIAAARRWPQLQLTVADLPAVAGFARKRVADEGLQERIHVRSVDATADRIEGEVEALSLVRILHDHDDARAGQILRFAKAALRPGGTLLVAEPMAADDAPGALIDAYFQIYLLAMGSGRPRTQRDIQALLEAVGFHRVRRHRTALPLITSVLTATA